MIILANLQLPVNQLYAFARVKQIWWCRINGLEFLYVCRGVLQLMKFLVHKWILLPGLRTEW